MLTKDETKEFLLRPGLKPVACSSYCWDENYIYDCCCWANNL